jgi:hypothetical protein
LQEDDEDEPTGGGKGQSPFMKEFFRKVAEVKKDMETIKRNMATMDKKHGAALTAVSNNASVTSPSILEPPSSARLAHVPAPNTGHACRKPFPPTFRLSFVFHQNKRQEELENLMDSTNSLIKGVKDTLGQMDKDGKEYQAKNKGKVRIALHPLIESSANTRAHAHAHAHLHAKSKIVNGRVTNFPGAKGGLTRQREESVAVALKDTAD